MTRLRELRKETGLPLREFSALFNMGFSNVARIERGEQQLSEELIIELCKYFDCTSDYLLGLSPIRKLSDITNNQIPQFIELNDTNKELAKNFVKMLLEQQENNK